MKCLKEKKTYHNSLFYSDYKCVRSNSAGLITIVQNLNQGSWNVFAQRQYVMRSSCKLCQTESQLTKTRRIFSYRRSVVRSFACCHVWSSLTHTRLKIHLCILCSWSQLSIDSNSWNVFARRHYVLRSSCKLWSRISIDQELRDVLIQTLRNAIFCMVCFAIKPNARKVACAAPKKCEICVDFT